MNNISAVIVFEADTVEDLKNAIKNHEDLEYVPHIIF